MNAPRNTPATSAQYLLEQPILQTFRINVFYPERHIPGGVLSLGGQHVNAHWSEILVVAVRRPQYATNDDAARATTDVLVRLGITTRNLDTAISLSDMLAEQEPDSHEIAALTTRLAHEGNEHQMDAATLSALEAYLPFTVERHPSPEHGVYLDSEEHMQFTNRAAMLMLAWLISAKL